jgi:peptidoglycan-N-acetylglucosamine deacetylase
MPAALPVPGLAGERSPYRERPRLTHRFLAQVTTGVLCVAAACAPATIGTGPGPSPEPASAAAAAPPAVWAFTAPWDTRSDSSLRANASRLDVSVTGWIQLDSLTGRPTQLYPDDPTIASMTTRLALVSSYHGQRFHPEAVRALAADDSALAVAAQGIAAIVSQGRYSGIVLDLEAQAPADTALTIRVARAFADSVRRHGASLVAMAVPAGDTAAYPTRVLMSVADLLVVMLYDEHWSTSPPGPIATPAWVRRTLGARVAEVGAGRIVAALPVYGYQWRNSQPATPLSFDDARRAAAQASVELARDPASLSLHAIQPGDWELWQSDAGLLRALYAEVTSLGVTKIALWRLGLEDPGVWSVLRR